MKVTIENSDIVVVVEEGKVTVESKSRDMEESQIKLKIGQKCFEGFVSDLIGE